MADALFRVRKLNVWYRQGKTLVHALKNIDIDIPERTLTVIMGRSGSGKSTFLRVLNRVIEIYNVKVEGEVYLKDKDIFKMDAQQLRTRVVMVLQRPIALPMSIYDNIAYLLKSVKKVNDSKKIRSKVEEALKLANLWDEVKDRLHTPASNLSGGQIQRLAIARALALDPEVLLLDEPTSHLDPESTRIIESTIMKLKDRISIIFVTHSVEQAKRLAEYVIFFENGRVVEAGYADEIFEKPKTDSLRKFLGLS